jgi:hypothetical protein
MLGHIIDYRSSGGSSFIFNNRINYNTTSPFYYIQHLSHFGSDIIEFINLTLRAKVW